MNDKEVREDRGVSQATGESGSALPEEFRAGLDEYFNRLERELGRAISGLRGDHRPGSVAAVDPHLEGPPVNCGRAAVLEAEPCGSLGDQRSRWVASPHRRRLCCLHRGRRARAPPQGCTVARFTSLVAETGALRDHHRRAKLKASPAMQPVAGRRRKSKSAARRPEDAVDRRRRPPSGRHAVLKAVIEGVRIEGRGHQGRASQANRAPLIQQFTNQARPLLRAELIFARNVCQLNREELRKMNRGRAEDARRSCREARRRAVPASGPACRWCRGRCRTAESRFAAASSGRRDDGHEEEPDAEQWSRYEAEMQKRDENRKTHDDSLFCRCDRPGAVPDARAVRAARGCAQGQVGFAAGRCIWRTTCLETSTIR